MLEMKTEQMLKVNVRQRDFSHKAKIKLKILSYIQIKTIRRSVERGLIWIHKRQVRLKSVDLATSSGGGAHYNLSFPSYHGNQKDFFFFIPTVMMAFRKSFTLHFSYFSIGLLIIRHLSDTFFIHI